MAIINKKQQVSEWRKGNPCIQLVGMEISIANMKNNMKVPQKKK